MTAFLFLRLLNLLGALVQLLRFLAALQYYVDGCGLLLYTEYGGLSRSDPQLVCLSVTIVSPAKTAEPIEVLYWGKGEG